MTAPAASAVPKVQTFVEQVEERRQRLATASISLVDERGHPLPSPEVVRRLPPGASIKWVPSAGFYGTQYFGLFKEWEPNDKRWERVRNGEYARENARDLVQMFPPECAPADMAAYVENRWGRRQGNAKAEADRLTAQAAKLYQQAEAEGVDRVVELSNERSDRETNHSLELRAGDGTANAQVTVQKDIGDGPKRLI